MITVHDLEVRAGARLLMEHVTFRVAAGDKVGLVGRNGAGKTTLMQLLTGQVFATEGTMEVLGASPVENADVLMPVGGPIFLSAAEAIRDQGDDAGITMIGVDADLYETSPDNADLFLTSVLKGMSTGVQTVVEQAAAGEFSNAPYVGTLENDGVGLAPFHDFESKVDPALSGELDTIREGIIAGDITVESPSALQ